MPATAMVHPLLTVTLRIDLSSGLTRPMPHVGPLNTAAGLEDLFLAPAFVAEVRCADGSLVHDFKGQTSCPACGLTGIVTGEQPR